MNVKYTLKCWYSVLALLLAATASLPAQSAFDKMPAHQLMQMMLAAPRLAVGLPVNSAAAFDPPVISPGGHAVYRVTLHCLDEAITRWPDKMPVPAQLNFTRGAEGMIMDMNGGNQMAPLTVVNYHATATRPGEYVIPEYQIEIYGQSITIPAATLQVQDHTPPLPSARELLLEPAKTNVYVGETIRIRVLKVAGENRMMPMMSGIQINGDGFITSKNDVRQQIAPVHTPDGQDLPAFIYDTSFIPFARGPLQISAQGFTSGNAFGGGQIIIRGGVTIPGGPPEYALLESEPVWLNIKSLPLAGRLTGFNGAIGAFTADPPHLSATSVAAGNPVKLTVTFHSVADTLRLGMPPAPATPAWEGFAEPPPNPNGNIITFTYTLIPQTDQTTATPEIPFCYFDPDRGQYVDLSIPSMAIQVLPGAQPSDTNNIYGSPADTAEKKPTLSGLAPTPGPSAATLLPLQERPWFYAVELGPVLLLLAWWLICRHQQYLEQHPDILRRLRARRALRREWRTLRQTVAARDARGFATSGVKAIQLACAPHFPAEPRALVCGDVLRRLPPAEQTGENGELIRQLFRAVDAQDFSAPGPVTDLLIWQPQLDRLLTQLEAQL